MNWGETEVLTRKSWLEQQRNWGRKEKTGHGWEDMEKLCEMTSNRSEQKITTMTRSERKPEDVRRKERGGKR